MVILMIILFYCSLFIFFIPHCFILNKPIRQRLIQQIGKKVYHGAFSLLATIGLAGMLFAIRETPYMSPIFSTYAEIYQYSRFLIPLAFFLIFLRFLPGKIRLVFRNSAYLGIFVWALTHFLMVKDNLAFVMFLGFMILSAPLFFVRMFKPTEEQKAKSSYWYDALALVLAIAFSFMMAYLHPFLFKVSNLYAGL